MKLSAQFDPNSKRPNWSQRYIDSILILLYLILLIAIHLLIDALNEFAILRYSLLIIRYNPLMRRALFKPPMPLRILLNMLILLIW